MGWLDGLFLGPLFSLETKKGGEEKRKGGFPCFCLLISTSVNTPGSLSLNAEGAPDLGSGSGLRPDLTGRQLINRE